MAGSSYHHCIVVGAPAAEVFGKLDFGTAGALEGAADAVGCVRTLSLGKGATIVEEQTMRAVDRARGEYRYRYAITNADNPWEVRGYVADVAVQQATENANQCVVTWSAKWESANDGIAALPSLIRHTIAQAEPKSKI